MKNNVLLAGDVGGTKAVLNVFAFDDPPKKRLADKTYASKDYPSLEAIVEEFLSTRDDKVSRAVFGVAGPVVDGRSKITNLPWVIDEEQMRRKLKFGNIKLINDLEATAHGLPVLDSRDIYPISKGNPGLKGNKAIVAPGTGLGEVVLTWKDPGYAVHATEGGHADFAPNNPTEIELLKYLQGHHEHVSTERVCSGVGIFNIYNFLKDSGREPEPKWLAEKISSAADPVPAIVEAALDNDKVCPICVQTLQLFSAILGAEAGNVALRIFATAGVYLGGGLPPRILPFLKKGTFLKAFCRKGRMQRLLKGIPVYVIRNPKAALMGAARFGFEYFKGKI